MTPVTSDDDTPRVRWARFSDGHFISASKMLLLRLADNSVATGAIDDSVPRGRDVRFAIRDEDGSPFPEPRRITHYSYLCLPTA